MFKVYILNKFNIMLAEDIDNININNIIISDPIKNSVMQYSNFYKIIFSNNIISFTGLYISFILNDITLNREKIILNNSNNIDTINKLSNIENIILNNIITNKKKTYKIYELFNNGNIKYCYNDIYIENFNNNHKLLSSNNTFDKKTFILKISGVWENKDSIGITFKIILMDKYITF